MKTRNKNRKSATLLVSLADVTDKGPIFKGIANIVDMKNNHNENYFINDQLTYWQQEMQRHNRQLKKANKDLPAMDRCDITFVKGQLHMNNVPYSKAITHPYVSAIMAPDSEDKIKSLYQMEGEVIFNGKCKFQALSQEIKSLDNIRCGYVKARRKFPGALHVVCAYYLPGHGIAASKDFVDNDELGPGHTLLDLLSENNIKNHAVYVARFYGGVNLGSTRFDSYREAATSVISQSSYNSIVRRNQFPLKFHSNTRAGKSHGRGRGGHPRGWGGYVKAASPLPYQQHAEGATSVTSPLASPLANPGATQAWETPTESWADSHRFRERSGSWSAMSHPST